MNIKDKWQLKQRHSVYPCDCLYVATVWSASRFQDIEVAGGIITVWYHVSKFVYHVGLVKVKGWETWDNLTRNRRRFYTDLIRWCWVYFVSPRHQRSAALTYWSLAFPVFLEQSALSSRITKHAIVIPILNPCTYRYASPLFHIWLMMIFHIPDQKQGSALCS